MQQLTPYEILPIIISYLRSTGLKKIAKQIEKKISEQNKVDGEFQKTDLNKIIKYYLKHKQQNVQEKNQAVKKSEKQITKKKVKKEMPKPKEESEEESEESSEEEEQKIVKKIEQKALPVKAAIVEEKPVPIIKTFNNGNNNFEKKNENFTRVDYSRMDQLKTELKDNSFQAKFRYGQGDQFGELGNQRLSIVQGRNFKKEKTKLKNKQFQGAGTINTAQINSIKL